MKDVNISPPPPGHAVWETRVLTAIFLRLPDRPRPTAALVSPSTRTARLAFGGHLRRGVVPDVRAVASGPVARQHLLLQTQHRRLHLPETPPHPRPVHPAKKKNGFGTPRPVAPTVGRVPRRIVPGLRHFRRRLLKMNNRLN